MCDYMVVKCFAGLGGFVACRSLSQRNNDPTKASRPWDVVRSFALTCYSIIKVTEDYLKILDGMPVFGFSYRC